MAKYLVSIRTSATSLFPSLSLPRALLPSSHTSTFRPTPSTPFPLLRISDPSPSLTSAFQTSLRILILSTSPNPSPARVIPPKSGFANHLLTPSPTPPPLLSPILRTTRASQLQPPLFLNNKDPGWPQASYTARRKARPLFDFTSVYLPVRGSPLQTIFPRPPRNKLVQPNTTRPKGSGNTSSCKKKKKRLSSLSPLPLTLSCYPGHVWIPQRSSSPGLRFPYKMVSHSADSHLTLPPARPLPLINETEIREGCAEKNYGG